MYIYNYIHIWRAAGNVKTPPANNYGQMYVVGPTLVLPVMGTQPI